MKQLILFLLFSLSAVAAADEPVDSRTMDRKVLCGYQGWFRCPGDGSQLGWRHWSRDSKTLHPSTLAFEMWPEMAEYTKDEKFAAPGFVHDSGQPAHLFSSLHSKTVDRHFDWMQQHEIDGVFLQRFLVELRNQSLDKVLENVRRSAQRTGRTYAICYDLSGSPKEQMFELLTSDWKRLVDELHVTGDERYLHHNGKPVLFIWGFYSDRFSSQLANQIIDFFKNDPKYATTLIGGCQWYWRSEKNPEWAKVFRRFDVISPWNVGNVSIDQGQRHAATHYWQADLDEAQKSKQQYLPVIYPGFAWTNLKGADAAKATVPRLKGEVYWRQFFRTAELGINMAYVAMFDEVDEGTAIFKVTNSPPTAGHFETYEGMPSDWYLRLTNAGAKMIRGEIPLQKTIPIQP